jgi:putative ABC transport system permease protein
LPSSEERNRHTPRRVGRRIWRFWRANPAADADAEVQFHLESQIVEYIAGGMTHEEARAAALRRFGDVDGIVHTLQRLGTRRERSVRLADRVDLVRQDIRFALRQFARNPWLTAVAIFTMALGIGANTAIFSVTYSVLVRPLPYAHPDRLVNLRERNGSASMFVTFGNYGVWRERASDFAALGAFHYGSFTLTGVGDPQRVTALYATAGYWKALYIPPAAGRYFTRDEDTPGAPHVVVLSHALWQSAFGADRDAVGRAISLNGEPYTVVGVAAPEYASAGYTPAVWVPMAITPAELQEHADHELTVIGLVRSGLTTRDAVRQLTSIETELARQYPHGYFDGGIDARALQSTLVGSVRPLLLLLTGAVGLVLLIACANVANLMLARGAARRMEVAIRGALGAGRRRLVAQLLVESLVLALLGGVVGLALALAAIRGLVRTAPPFVPQLHEATINVPVLAFTLGVAFACGIVFGLLPALRTSKVDLQQTLRDGARGSVTAVRDRARAGLVVAEIAIALVLLNGAGLLLRSAVTLQQVPAGFDTHDLLMASIALPDATYPTDPAIAGAFDRMLEQIRAVPGVTHAALVSRAPIMSGGYDCGVTPEGSSNPWGANMRGATPGYFETMGVPLVRGRSFTAADRAGAPGVAVINATLARELFGSADPIGRRVSACAAGQGNWVTIVGVTGDVRANGLGQPPPDEVYFPAEQFVQRGMFLAVRGAAPVTRLVPPIRRVLAAVDPTVPLAQVTTMDDVVDRSMASSRFAMTLFGLLALTGLSLAAVGIYGVIAYFVVQRTQEFGVRMAVGAAAGGVVKLVVWHGLVLGLVGVGIGSVASLFLTRLLASLLYEVSPRDPLTLAGVAVLLVAVAVLASFLPALRATRVDPLSALRAG